MRSSISIIVPIHEMYKKLMHLNTLISELPSTGIEVILVDDFTSPEASSEIKTIVNDFSAKEIKLVKGHFGSPGATRNAGLSEATGDWIVFVDSDDRLHPSEFLDFLQSCPTNQIQIFQFRKIDFTSGKVLQSLSHTGTTFDLVFDMGLWRMAFPKKFLTEARFQNLRMGEDVLFFLDVFQKNLEVQFNSIHTYDYVMGLGNQLTSNRDALKDLSNLLNELERRIETYEDSKELVTLLYFKNTLSAIKHLGLVQSRKYIVKSVKLFIASRFDEKQNFFGVFWKLVRK
jgi:glycosyltransferase involved in cell wall biosynthesis